MKPAELLRTLTIALVAGGLAFFVAQRFSATATTADEVTWLIEEFKLSPSQADAVQALHEAYRPVCEAHCMEVMEAQQAVAQATDPAAQAKAERELAELKQRCHSATRAHLESVAAVMTPDQGRRYLETITPLLSAHSHESPFDLR